ncbi:hypothetical protein TorRG33x02_357260, partial [Trema orientale]
KSIKNIKNSSERYHRRFTAETSRVRRQEDFWASLGGRRQCWAAKTPETAAASRDFPTRLGCRRAEMITGVASWEDLGQSSRPESTPASDFGRSTITTAKEKKRGRKSDAR